MLILAPNGRDAEVVASVLGKEGLESRQVASLGALRAEIRRGAAAAIVCEEAISADERGEIAQLLTDQEPWSDFPFVVLLSRRAGPMPPYLKSTLASLGNVVLLERPLSAETLASAGTAAIRARARQYAARDVLADREAVASELALLNKHLEERVQQRTKALAQANDRLSAEVMERERVQKIAIQAQKLEALGRLTGGVAHDFNNVLSVIMGNVELIAMFAPNDVTRARAKAAQAACKKGAKLTGQLLAFARNQSLSLRPLPISSLFQNVEQLARPLLGPDIELVFHICEGVTGALCDASQLEMALLNLAINSRDAMSGRGRLIINAVRSTPPRSLLPQGSYVRIAVADNGMGMTPEVAAKAFEPFFTTKEVGAGTGLGLSQVYGMAEQSGGAAQVESALGQGTVVEIWLQAADGGESLEQELPVDPREVAGLSVLVVEDDSAVRAGIVDALQSLDCHVAFAESAEQGFAALHVSKPDLLLTDYLMPGMTGAELAIKAREAFPDLPVLIATGYADMEEIEQAVGADSILRKPFHLSDLTNAVARAARRGTRAVN